MWFLSPLPRPPIFLPAEEGIRLPRWSWDQLSRMTDQRRSSKMEAEDFHRCHAFRGIMQDETPVTPNITPTWHLTSRHASPSQYLSSIQRDPLCLSTSVFYISHDNASPAHGEAGILKRSVVILCSVLKSHVTPKWKFRCERESRDQTDKYSALRLLRLLHNKSHHAFWAVESAVNVKAVA